MKGKLKRTWAIRFSVTVRTKDDVEGVKIHHHSSSAIDDKANNSTDRVHKRVARSCLLMSRKYSPFYIAKCFKAIVWVAEKKMSQSASILALKAFLMESCTINQKGVFYCSCSDFIFTRYRFISTNFFFSPKSNLTGSFVSAKKKAKGPLS